MAKATDPKVTLALKIDKGGPDDCWEWAGYRDKAGYGRMQLAALPGISKAHRAAWVLEHGPIAPGACVLHRCDNPPCCNPKHLWLGTKADNNVDCARKGRNRYSPNLPFQRKSRGEKHGSAKLNEAAVKEIRASHEKSRDLAKRFGVSQSTITRARSGRRWSCVPSAAIRAALKETSDE